MPEGVPTVARLEATYPVAEEEKAAGAEIERRRRESLEDANRRKQASITEANARVAEATDEAQRRVREATEEANKRINAAADRVEALRSLRAGIAEQVKAARAVLHEASAVLGDGGPVVEPVPDEQPTRPATPRPAPAPKSSVRDGAASKPTGE